MAPPDTHVAFCQERAPTSQISCRGGLGGIKITSSYSGGVSACGDSEELK